MVLPPDPETSEKTRLSKETIFVIDASGSMVETREGSYHYRVGGAQIVHESRTDLIFRSGRAELTLITCYPFESLVPGGPLRYVVHAT